MKMSFIQEFVLHNNPFEEYANDFKVWNQLRSLWTAYHIYHNLEVDTWLSDLMMMWIKENIETNITDEWIDNFLCEDLV